jgi:hypothetical protein
VLQKAYQPRQRWHATVNLDILVCIPVANAHGATVHCTPARLARDPSAANARASGCQGGRPQQWLSQHSSNCLQPGSCLPSAACHNAASAHEAQQRILPCVHCHQVVPSTDGSPQLNRSGFLVPVKVRSISWMAPSPRPLPQLAARGRAWCSRAAGKGTAGTGSVHLRHNSNPSVSLLLVHVCHVHISGASCPCPSIAGHGMHVSAAQQHHTVL